MKEQFINVSFQKKSLALLDNCNDIIEQYQSQGLRLSLRQLYYQLVSRNIIENTERAYKNVGKLVSQGRLAGILDWKAIEDRIRVPRKVAEWDSPAQILNICIEQYRIPRWNDQDNYVELWCEKDALAGVLTPITEEYHVTLMINRGYSSQSAMKEAAERLQKADQRGKLASIRYIGDLDPSGEDMVRDVEDRLTLLTRGAFDFDVIKVAITPEQVAQYNPPPNPAKMSDSRAARFVAEFGQYSYEADALPPDVLDQIVRDEITSYIDFDVWEESIEAEDRDKTLLEQARDSIMEQRGDDDDDEAGENDEDDNKG